MVTLLGKYRLIAELGHGGMGQVFLAMMEGPARFAKLAVVKRLRDHLLEDREFVGMLLEEARITARLNHPNVVQLIEVGTDGEEHFLVMEYLEGESFGRLRRRAANRGAPIDGDGELAIIADALAGLHYAHELADYDGTPLCVVHRDFTPSNVFVTTSGHVKVVDFGIARAHGRAEETRQGIIKGKIRYMAPEHASGQAIDRRADLFAAAVMIWEAAAGRRFWSCSDEEIGVRLVTGDYERSPRAVNPNVHPAIDDLCRRALEPDVEKRIATAAEMRYVLEQVLGDRLPAARRAVGQRVEQLFSRERAQIRKCIDEASSLLDTSLKNSSFGMSLAPLVVSAPGSNGFPGGLTPPSGADAPLPVPLPIEPAPRSASNPAMQVGHAAPPPVATPAPRSRALRHVLAGTVATFVLAGAVWGYVLLRTRDAVAAASSSALHEPVVAAPRELAESSATSLRASPAPARAVEAQARASAPRSSPRRWQRRPSHASSPRATTHHAPTTTVAAPAPSEPTPAPSSSSTTGPPRSGLTLDKSNPWRTTP